jgi:hygromycin-B 4-O-kinase
MAAADRVSLESATRFLRERFGNGVQDVSPIAHGEWSSTFSFAVDGQQRIIRFGVHRDDYERDAFAATLSSPELPVPRVLEIGAGLGRHFAVSERAFGAYLDDLDGAAFAAALPALFEAMDAMRAVKLPTARFGEIDGAGRASFADWRSCVLAVGEPSARLPGWRDGLQEDPSAAALFDEAFARLEATATADVEPHLVHADLLNFNVLVEAGRPSAFLDWGCAMAADCLYDLAWLIYCQFWYPAWDGIDIFAAAKAHFDRTNVNLVAGLEERLQVCLLHIGLGNLRYVAFVRRPEGILDACRRVQEVLDGAVGTPVV